MYAVRAIRPDEIAPMVQAGEAVHRVSQFAHMDYDHAKLCALAARVAERPDVLFLQVITRNDMAVGVLFAIASESFFGRDKTAIDLVFFVAPQVRGRCGETLREIVANYHAWARAVGAKIATLGCSTQIAPERTRDLYEHLGYPQTGSLHATVLS